MLEKKRGVRIELIQVLKDEQKEITDLVAKEIVLSIYVNQKNLVTLNCSPGNLKYLAVGFLYTMGIIRDKKDIVLVKTGRKSVHFQIKNPLLSFEDLTSPNNLKNIKQSMLRQKSYSNLKEDNLKININTIYTLMRTVEEKAVFFKLTGGVHSCALADINGSLRLFCEDISRYNTIDRILGEALLKDINMDDKVMLTSCRITSGIMQKIVTGNISIVISRSAPTDYAVKLAKREGITLIGFARKERMNIYSHPERVAN
ncbi:MAG: formate dehydrogenase accessory sulfurtransferase FdhD [Candidatus Caldatribacteriota bacterium]